MDINTSILKAQESRALLLTLFDVWNKISGTIVGSVKFEISFRLLGSDGAEYDQNISITIIPPYEEMEIPSPFIISQKISPPVKDIRNTIL